MQQLHRPALQRAQAPAARLTAPFPLAVQAGRCRVEQRRRALSGVPDPAGELPPFSTLLSTPVYSLSSRDPATGAATLNMITYASPIALRPQRKYALGLYVESQSYANVKASGRAVLQILQQQHAELFQLLGKTSGRDVDKVAALRDAGCAVHEEFGLPVLSDAAGVMELRVASDFIPAGDHHVVVCDVVAWKYLDSSSSSSSTGPDSGSGGPDSSSSSCRPLYTGFLKQQGYL